MESHAIHEDDSIRAIRAAWDIHDAVARMTDRFKRQLERPLAMHSGIASGLVVTGQIDLATGRHGITGEAVTRALLLTNLAESNEILVGPGTMASVSGFFLFEKRNYSINDEGTTDIIDAYRVMNVEKTPEKIHRVQGLSSRLIGRESEMTALGDALAAVSRGRGCCVFLEGDAGTGKSRLISEFRNEQVPPDTHWHQGNAYAYNQEIPYSPLIDLLRRAMDLRADDSAAVVRKKIVEEVIDLEGEDGTMAPILERLFTHSGDKAIKITPEVWNLKLRQALVQLTVSQSRSGVTVISIEDFHWADPSTLELFRMMLNDADLPVLFLISYRPGFFELQHFQIDNPYYRRQTILIEDLSQEKAEAMVKSLLRAERVPRPLLNFVAENLGGNPFFIEEVINSLIDTGTLENSVSGWQLNGTIGDNAVSPNLSSLIATRLDRLDYSAKCIVQEASVIGKQFSPAVLKQISASPKPVDRSLAILKSLGLILKSDDPEEDLYVFKHSLIQDVAYKSLLNRQRKNLHEKIARVMENQGAEWIDSFCETLAFHFGHGHSLAKAVDYLAQSGRKSLKNNAIIESHNYYDKAYQILTNETRPVDDASTKILKLLLDWFFVFQLRGQYGDVLNLLKQHESTAMNCRDLQLKGMYLTFLGWAYQRREHLDASRQCLMEAIDIGEQIKNDQVIVYACTHLILTCTDLGRLDEAVDYAGKAEAIYRVYKSQDPPGFFEMDQYLIRLIYMGTAIAYWFKGDCHQCRKLGDKLLASGEKLEDEDSISNGHLAHGMGCIAAGDYHGAIEKCMMAVDRLASPPFIANARFIMAYAQLLIGDVSLAEKNLQEVISFCRVSGYEYIGTSANALSSLIAVARGNAGAGVKTLNRFAGQCMTGGKRYHAMTFHYMLGRIYLRFVLREGTLDFSFVVNNLPFLLMHLPRAAKHAEHHFNTTLHIASEINAMGFKGQVSLDLGRLFQSQKRNDLAMQLIKESIVIFKQLGAEKHLQRAQAALDGLF